MEHDGNHSERYRRGYMRWYRGKGVSIEEDFGAGVTPQWWGGCLRQANI